MDSGHIVSTRFYPRNQRRNQSLHALHLHSQHSVVLIQNVPFSSYSHCLKETHVLGNTFPNDNYSVREVVCGGGGQGTEIPNYAFTIENVAIKL